MDVLPLTGQALQDRIDVLEAELQVRKRTRKSEMNREKARRQQADPAFVAARLKGQREFWADPVRSAAARERARTQVKKLPPMSPEDRELYRKLRRNGIDRAEALRTVLPTPPSLPQTPSGGQPGCRSAVIRGPASL